MNFRVTLLYWRSEGGKCYDVVTVTARFRTKDHTKMNPAIAGGDEHDEIWPV